MKKIMWLEAKISIPYYKDIRTLEDHSEVISDLIEIENIGNDATLSLIINGKMLTINNIKISPEVRKSLEDIKYE